MASEKNLGVGRRGAGGQASAAEIWGVSEDDYLEKADPWPLDADGELMLGIKVENRRALSNVELTTSVPGIAFAEWGQGDMSMSFGYKTASSGPHPFELQKARAKVFAAWRAAGLSSMHSPLRPRSRRLTRASESSPRESLGARRPSPPVEPIQTGLCLSST